MSFAVHFLPAGTTALPQPTADTDNEDEPAELTADEIATWDQLHPLLLELLPADGHDLAKTTFSRQLVHDATGLMVTWQHEDYQASLPFWSANETSGAFDTLVRIAETIESTTGLVGVDEISEGRFLDHHAEVAASFGAIADGFQEAMERQTVLGWLRSMFHRR